MNTAEYVVNHEKCTGCRACSEICPVQAITMQYDDEGFLKPYIDFELCIQCGKCKITCPALNPKYENWDLPICYAACAADDIRKSSTSGGLFFCLAKYILDNGGIVFGAAFSEDFWVRHISVKNAGELNKICHTKYVQSDTAHTFSEAKKYLDQGISVLYSGCPCQIAGFKAYLGKEYHNLLLVDILCMQVPPAPLFQRYLDETYGGISNIISIQFRDKKKGWKSKSLTVTTKQKVNTINDYPLGWMSECQTEEYPDRTVYHRTIEYDAYLKIFYNKMTMSSVCADCRFATFPRQGDISLGDFWGIENHNSSFDDAGTSLILVNNAKGQEYFEKIKPNLQKCTIQQLDHIGGNRAKGNLPIYRLRERLYELLSKTTVEKAVKQCQDNLYDIGIVGNWMTINYGGALTYFALYSVLNDMGYSTILISHPSIRSLNDIISSMRYEKMPYPDYAYRASPQVITGLKPYNRICDTFIVGSDQLFNYKLYHDMHGFADLRWVYDNHRKIAYAASFGLDDFYGPEYERARLQYFLSKFDFFSVREESGVEIAKNRFERTAQWVLDPVFLCDIKHYDKLIQDCKQFPPNKPYLFSYMLDTDFKREEILLSFSDKLGLPIYVIDDAIKLEPAGRAIWSLPVLPEASNNQFLAYIKEAKYVVTDSFHGMCFCIIFKIPFTVIINSKRGSTRMESLVKLLGIENRMVHEISEDVITAQISSEIDYDKVYKILDKEKERCMQWLHNAITQDIGPKALSSYDVLDLRMDILANQLNTRISANAPIQKMPTFRKRITKKIKGGLRSIKERGMIRTAKIIIERAYIKLKKEISKK